MKLGEHIERVESMLLAERSSLSQQLQTLQDQIHAIDKTLAALLKVNVPKLPYDANYSEAVGTVLDEIPVGEQFTVDRVAVRCRELGFNVMSADCSLRLSNLAGHGKLTRVRAGKFGQGKKAQKTVWAKV